MSVRKHDQQSLLQKLKGLPTLIAALFALVGSGSSSAAEKPNVIFILMDDMGWRDVGFMGNTFIETPNLDRLAKEGLVFTSAYASAPNCAPTRACLMSGQYTPRHGIYTVVDPRQPPGSPWHKLQAADSLAELNTNITTVAESLKSGGYATAFFGMWNLGRGRTGPVTPGGQGFDKVVFPENLGFGKDEYFDGDGNYLSDRLTDSLLEFVESNKDRPFFAYYPDHAVHAPYNPKPDLLKKYQQKMDSSGDRRDNAECAATVEAVDQNVGRILQKLKDLKIDQNTMIIFTSDNGGTNQYTAPLKGSKGQLYEGGIRIPLVVHWAGLKNPGRKCSVPVSSVDWFPTLVELTGAPTPSKQIQDGISLMPLIEGGDSLKRDRLFWHFPSYVGKSAPSSAVRVGDYKLIEFFEDGGTTELYNLADDPNEENNLARSEPAKAKELYAILQDWQKETGAAIPDKANPNYDPNAERPRGGPNGAGGGNAGGGGGGGKGQGGMNKGKKGRR
ncbi:MAG: sulfatase [Planctomycetaceae bacterium]|nr:sulfatase [Planctomycetaceae bacterium]